MLVLKSCSVGLLITLCERLFLIGIVDGKKDCLGEFLLANIGWILNGCEPLGSLVLQMEVHSYKLKMLLSHELIYRAYVAGIFSS